MSRHQFASLLWTILGTVAVLTQHTENGLLCFVLALQHEALDEKHR